MIPHPRPSPPPMRPAVLRAALLRPAGLALLGAAALAACSPTVRVEAPKEPIRIDLNVRIEQEVRVRVDRELEDVFADNEDIF